MLGYLLRGASFLVAFALSAVGIWRLSDLALTRLGVERGNTSLDFTEVLESWRSRALKEPEGRRIVFVGDSMMQSPSPGIRTLPDRVWRVANQHAPASRHFRSQALAIGGMTILPEYFLVDEITSAKPSLVVLEVNLRGMQPGSLGGFGLAELAGLVRWPRLAEAAFAPLGDAGLTFDRVLLYRLLTKNHLERPWAAVLDRQARTVNVLLKLEEGLERRLDVNTLFARKLATSGLFARNFVPKRPRASAFSVMASLGAALGRFEAPNDRLRLFELVLRDLKRAETPVLVWVSPVNVEHIRSLGLATDGLPWATAKLAAIARDAGASFLDLHALLPDAAFRDSGDHPTLEGTPDGTAAVAKELADAVSRAKKAPRER
jgi:hypothetical protein